MLKHIVSLLHCLLPSLVQSARATLRGLFDVIALPLAWQAITSGNRPATVEQVTAIPHPAACPIGFMRGALLRISAGNATVSVIIIDIAGTSRFSAINRERAHLQRQGPPSSVAVPKAH